MTDNNTNSNNNNNEPTKDHDLSPSRSNTNNDRTTTNLPSLKKSLRTAVQTTNRMLSTAEATVDTLREPVASTWQKVTRGGATAAAHVVTAYDRRHEYGPLGIVTTAVATGAVVTLRRGRVPGAVAALLAGGVVYGVVYGLDGLELSDYLPDRPRRD